MWLNLNRSSHWNGRIEVILDTMMLWFEVMNDEVILEKNPGRTKYIIYDDQKEAANTQASRSSNKHKNKSKKKRKHPENRHRDNDNIKNGVEISSNALFFYMTILKLSFLWNTSTAEAVSIWNRQIYCEISLKYDEILKYSSLLDFIISEKAARKKVFQHEKAKSTPTTTKLFTLLALISFVLCCCCG